MLKKVRSPRNKTILVSDSEKKVLRPELISGADVVNRNISNRIILGDSLNVLRKIPSGYVDLMVADPPYNIRKIYGNSTFKKKDNDEYNKWLDSWLSLVPRILKPNATIYICCDWSCSSLVFDTASKYFHIINRITWEREKGRGALSNWKNCAEDIWYLTNGNEPKFNLDAVKLRRRVIAPYTAEGVPKGWESTNDGNFRYTAPSNLWTDITVPFWSMPENTEHPTQKPEKLVAKLILASSDAGDMIFDPFLGSGTTAVVAKKLGRDFSGIEIEEDYCLLSQKRVNAANVGDRIQGYENGVFLERNTMQMQTTQARRKSVNNGKEGTLL